MEELTIIIPFSSDRQNQLEELLPRLPEHTKVIVVEQVSKETYGFNRGLMKNIGFLYSDTENVCFHDVDWIDDIVDYSECESPMALCKMEYGDNFGGVVLLKSEHFRKANGYPNLIFQWGLEDDLLLERLRKSGLNKIDKPGKYKMVEHDRSRQDIESSVSGFYARYDSRVPNLYKFDGLNTVFYTSFDIEYCDKYTLLRITI